MSTMPTQANPKSWLSKVLVVPVVLGVGAAAFYVWDLQEKKKTLEKQREQAKAQCEEWADKLDKQTTDAGIYVRDSGESLPDDPWGQKLRLSYSQGGVAEMLEVRSLGPDGLPNTDDDIRIGRMAANLKGIGTGIKTNTEETARNAARGAVKGVAEGIKDVIGGSKKTTPATKK
jgi:Type II secretion system (T2SS), protein G